ncbi:kinesin heavy chain-like isoform X2 [Halichondria panicea]
MDDSCRIRVVCRVRPLNTKEKANSDFVVKFPSASTVELTTHQRNHSYTYDHVLNDTSSQPEVYAVAAKPLVNDVLSGYNATIFAYGQTSSGKTHTMEGELMNTEMRGIIPRIIEDMFNHIYSMDANLEIHIKVSYFEIYMEKITDLLDITKSNLSIGETKRKVPYVKGITERFVTSPEEIIAVLDEGKANRHVAVTSMNAHSSRSHAVFLISIKQENKETHKTLTGKLYLVDLAGSEKVDKTNAMGLTLDEAKTINKSLLSLSNVISALAEGNKPYIPYRDSKLTRVLQESLGGNARTTLIICASPSSYNTAETKSTLQFGDRAKTIKNHVAMNVELTAEEWRRRYEKQKEANQKLKTLVEKYEGELSRWRVGESVPEAEQSSRKTHTTDDNPSPLHSSTHHTDPSHMGAGQFRATPTPEMSRLYEEEKARMCQQIDEKDEEIHSQGEMIEKLTIQMAEMEESLHTSERDTTSLRQQITIFEQELVNSQDEVHEVMHALEQLAVSYDTKDREIESIATEKQLLLEEMGSLQDSMEQKTQELNSLKDVSTTESRKNKERLSSLFSDLREIGTVLGNHGDLPLESSSDIITDDDFARVRIHLSNLRCEARTLLEQRNVLENAEREARDKATTVIKELGVCRLKISQYEAQNESLSVHLRESEGKKKELEGALVTLNEQLLSLKTKEHMLLASGLSSDEDEEALETEPSFEVEMVTQLKSQISTTEELITSMTQKYNDQLLEMDELRSELLQSQNYQREEEQKYSKIRLQMRVKERLRHDLGGLTDTVSRELERLNGLRQSYISHMTARLNKQTSEGDELLTPDRREIQFLERNLEELSRTHKKTASENSELQREIPRLHTILAGKSRRIGELESLLQETKMAANQEYERLRTENEKTKQNFMKRLKEKEKEAQSGRVIRRQGPSIVRPVPRKGNEVSASSSRDALLAGAGVTVIGQRRKPRQLDTDSDSNISDSVYTTPPLSS